MKLLVSGSGRWGTSIALYCDKIKHQVSLLCSRNEGYQFIKKNSYSPHLPNFSIPKSIHILHPSETVASDTELIIFSNPISYFREKLESLRGIQPQHILITINKGIEKNTLLFAPEIMQEFFPKNTLAHLGGPCFPEGLLLDGKPAAETLACKNQAIGKKLQQELNSLWFRVYLSQDLKGIAFLGAMKNVFAIVAGIIQGCDLGEEAMSFFITRGMSEAKKLCQALKIEENTLYGLSGLGDVVLTCYSQKNSQNKNFGIQLGLGQRIEDTIKKMGDKVAEGYPTTEALYRLTEKYSIETPIIKTAYQTFYKGLPIQKALQILLNRPLKIED